MEFSLAKCLTSSQPVASDKMLSLYTTDNGLVFAVWKVCCSSLHFVVMTTIEIANTALKIRLVTLMLVPIYLSHMNTETDVIFSYTRNCMLLLMIMMIISCRQLTL